jgi:hypothetical protein
MNQAELAMRFKSLSIKNTGPVREKKIRFKDVNLIIGNNEEGKTTVVDILVQKLFRKKGPYSKSFWNERFSFEDEAVLDIEGELPEEEMQKYYSLLVVREGDNQWKGRSSKNDITSIDLWNEDIKEILYGNDRLFSRINKDLETILGINRNNSWLNVFKKNLAEFHEKLHDEIGNVDRIKNNNAWIALESGRLGGIQHRIEEMSEARKHAAGHSDKEMIDRFFSMLDKKEETAKVLEDLEKRKLDSVFEEWDSLRKQKVHLEKAVTENRAELQSEEKIKNEKLAYLKDVEKEIEETAAKKTELIRERELLRDEKEKTEKSFGETAGSRGKSGLAGIIPAAAGGLLLLTGLAGYFSGLSFIGGLTLPVLASTIMAGAGAAVFLSGAVLLFVRWKSDRSLTAAQRKNKEDRTRFMKEWESRWNVLESRFIEKERSLKKHEDKKAELEKQIGDLQGRKKPELDKMESDFRKLKDRENDLIKIYHSIDEVVAGITKRDHLKSEQQGTIRELENLEIKLKERFQTSSPSQLKQELDTLRSLPDAEGRSMKYSEEAFVKLTGEKDASIREIGGRKQENEKLNGEVLARINEGLKNLAVRGKTEMMDAFYSEIKMLHMNEDVFNIYAFNEKVNDLVKRVDEDISRSEKLQNANQAVQSRLDTLINGVFHTGIFVNALTRITGGKYTGVKVSTDNSQLRLSLETGDGDVYDFSSLSTGARNQLYFAVRLALARDKFGEGTGVFILDDAFITFDEGRRRSSLELLKEYASEGWQIIYAGINEKAMEKLFGEVFGKGFQKIVL